MATTQLFVELSKPEAAGSGLRADSIVLCENLVTYKQSRVLKHLGRFGDSLMTQIDDCLRAALALQS
jgi:mRNA-degrading endonuclease toxin of MazEF toxin-antitoxin module